MQIGVNTPYERAWSNIFLQFTLKIFENVQSIYTHLIEVMAIDDAKSSLKKEEEKNETQTKSTRIYSK